MAKVNVQDIFLNELRKSKMNCTIYLVNGVPLRGKVLLFNGFTIYFQTQEGRETLLYKHAISTIIPAKSINSAFKSILREFEKQDSQEREAGKKEE